MLLLAQWTVTEWCAVLVPAIAILGGLVHLVKIGTETRSDVRALKSERRDQKAFNKWSRDNINDHEVRIVKLEPR